MRTLKKRQLAQAGTGPETIALDKTASGDCDMTGTCIIGAFEMAALKMLTRSVTIHQHSQCSEQLWHFKMVTKTCYQGHQFAIECSQVGNYLQLFIIM